MNNFSLIPSFNQQISVQDIVLGAGDTTRYKTKISDLGAHVLVGWKRKTKNYVIS